MMPEIETETAVMSVAQTITTSRSRLVLIPMLFASSSPRGEDVHPPAEQEEGDDADDDHHARKIHILHGRAGEAAHQPVGDGRQLVVGIGDEFDVGDGMRRRGCRRELPARTMLRMVFPLTRRLTAYAVPTATRPPTNAKIVIAPVPR